uniref:Uncharacterized protein n=1 Tax=Arundo donax TaxID=35708 RepID=A0A0A9BLE0_ARUDO
MAPPLRLLAPRSASPARSIRCPSSSSASSS